MVNPNLFPNVPSPQEHLDKHQDASLQTNENSLSGLTTRLKILEERYTTMRKKSQLTDQNIIESEHNQFQEITLLSDDLLNLKRRVKELTEKLDLITDEVENFANKREFIVLKRYVDFWEPMDFVTRKEVNSFLRNKFSK